MSQTTLFQPVLTITPDTLQISADLPAEARALLDQLQTRVNRNVLYEGVLYPAPLYFARLVSLLGEPETYETALSELRRQQALLVTITSEQRPPTAPSSRDLRTFRRLFAEVRQALYQTPPLLGTLFWYVPESEQANGPISPDDYLTRLLVLERSREYAKVQAGIEEMSRYLGKSNEQQFDAWFQSVTSTTEQPIEA